MKRLLALLMAAAAALSLAGCGDEPASAQVFAMDTVMELTAYGKNGQAAVRQAQEEIQRLDVMLDRTDPHSAVSLVNAGAGTPVEVSGELSALIGFARDCADATDHAFDITIAPVMDAWGFTTEDLRVPGQETLHGLLSLVDSGRIVRTETDQGASITLGAGQSMDLGGIAKGYVSDCVEAAFREKGVESAKITLGGNVFVLGAKPDGTPWRVAVQDPADPQGYAAVVSLTDAFAITSGSYQRYFEQDGRIYHHIIDPSTGCPADSGLVSVTVVAAANGRLSGDGDCHIPGNGAMCDAFSTALFVMGEEKALAFRRQWNAAGGPPFELVLVTAEGRVAVTDGLAEELEEIEGSGYTYEIVH